MTMTENYQPIGYVFTDIEGSTKRWENLPERMANAIGVHDAILASVATEHGGEIITRNGDGAFLVFRSGNPLQFAVDLQLQMQSQVWKNVGGLKIRVGVHASPAGFGDELDPLAINRAARIADSAWGGQIVASSNATDFYPLSVKCSKNDEGLCSLRDIPQPIQLFSISHENFQRKEHPPLRTLSAGGISLPIHAVQFIGRSAELEELGFELSDAGCRILTIVGAAGHGKSRLAQYYSKTSSAKEFTTYLSADGLDNWRDLCRSLMGALGLPTGSLVQEQNDLVRYLKTKSGLLVLDNSDALVKQVTFLSGLLRECSGIRLLITSREPIGLTGERIFKLSGMSYADGNLEKIKESDAYKLFIAYARQVDPSYELETSLEYEFLQLCATLDGSPLGLQLAAHWLPFIRLPELREDLQNGFDLLDEVPETSGASHLKLQHILELSWQRLSTQLQEIVSALSIFRGSFSDKAAMQIVGCSFGDIARLEQKSLLYRTPSGRLAWFPLVSNFAVKKGRQQTNSYAEIEDKHMRYFLSKFCTTMSGNEIKPQSDLLDDLDEDWENLKSAWLAAMRLKSYDLMERSIEPIFYYIVLRSKFDEAVNMFQLTVGEYKLQSHLSAICASCFYSLGEYEQAERMANNELSSRDNFSRAHANHILGNVEHARGNIRRALELYKFGRDIREKARDYWGLNTSDSSMASAYITLGDFSKARWHVKRAYESATQVRNTVGLVVSHLAAGAIAEKEQRLDDAISNYQVGLELETDTHSPQLRIPLLVRLARTLSAKGKFDDASRCQSEAIELNTKAGDKRQQAELLLSLARSRRRMKDYRGARQHVFSSLDIGRKMGSDTIQASGLLELARIDITCANHIRATRIVRTLSNFDLAEEMSDYNNLVVELGLANRQNFPDDSMAELLEEILKARGTEDLLL